MNSKDQSSQPFSTIRHKHRAGKSKFDLEACLHHLRVGASGTAMALSHAVGSARPQAGLKFLPVMKIILQPNAEF